MKKLPLLFILILLHQFIFSQRGKDGTVTIGAGSSTVNVYTPISTDASAGTTTINVLNSSGYTPGDLIYIIQMQGAAVNCYTNQFANPQNPDPHSPAFGKIVNYNNAGNNEFSEIASVSGNTITLNCALKNNYTAAGKVQAVKVPRYAALTVTGTITCAAWNGTIGGVIAIEVLGNTVINASGRINASALGFRGGFNNGKLVGGGGGSSWGRVDQAEGAFKGEGIAGDTALYHALFNGPRCKGAVANAGGGGNSNNAGGGGGGNAGDTGAYTGLGNPDISLPKYVTAWNLEPGFSSTTTSSGGGRGGYTFSDAANNPTVTPPGNGNGWGGDNRRVEGGVGGRPLNYNSGRLFLGGGGGAGDENDGYGGSGGHGGGIINIISYGTVSGAGQIISNGAQGANTSTVLAALNNVRGRDGAGGGGAGGAIVIKSIAAISTITLSANGGRGGNQQMVSNISLGTTAMAYGPGGGGGGGYIGTTAATITSSITGGFNGIVLYLSGTENCLIDNHFPPNGATRGGAGVVTSTLSALETLTATPSVTICANNTAALAATTTGTGTIGWYTSSTGGSLLGTGTAFTTSVLTTVGVYTVYAGFCPGGTYRVPSLINVTTSPTISATTPTICSGQTATITASGASTYTWSTGANTNSITPTLTITTTYTINGSNGTCSSSAIGTVIVNPSGSITVNSASICSGQSATLTAGAANSYTWSTGQNAVTIVITPTVNTTYTINATSASGCILTNTSLVSVNIMPTVSVNSATICSGTAATLTAIGASTYSWNTGALTAVINPSPSSTTVYTITGANGSCTNIKTSTVTVNTTPTITVNSVTICSGNNATLTAGGAATYTWNTGANTATINPSPLSTTSYTISGSSLGCNDLKTATVTVNTTPTVSVNSATICSGATATLTATGATTYTWNTGASTAIINPSPIATTVYTITGANGNCTNVKTSTVIVNTTPTITVNSATICSGNNATLTAGGAATYTWNTGVNTAVINPSPSSTTVYTISGTSNNCNDAKTATVTVVTTPTVSVSSATTCAGSSATITAAGAASYLWNTSATTSAIVVSPTTTTNYTVTGSNGTCSSTAISTVVVSTSGVISVNSATICSGQSATLTAGAATNYLWNTGASTSSIIVSPSVTTNYTINATSGGCQLTNTTAVTVNTSPTVTVNSATICSGNSATLTANGATTYSWNTGASTAVINPSPLATTIYTITGSNGTCTNIKTSTVTVNTTPTVSVNSATICSGSSATLTAGGAVTYTWNTGASTAVINPSPSSTTVYTVIGTANTCTNINTATISVNTTPTVSINSATICSGTTATLTASGATTYTWNTGANTAAINPSPSSTTVYTISGSSAGCNDIKTATVSVNTTPTVSVNSTTICSGTTATLTASGAATYTWNTGEGTAVINPAPSSTTVYTITGANGNCTDSKTSTVSVINTPTVSANSATTCAGTTVTLTATGATSYSWNTGANTSTIAASPSVTTTYTISGSNGICSAFGTATITIAPTGVIAVNSPSICSGQSATLTAGSASNYTWSTGANLQSITVTPTATTIYIINATSGACSLSNTATVTVDNNPTVTVNSGTICSGNSIILTAGGASSYTWSTGLNTNTLSLSPSATTIYTITGANGNCTSVSTATVLVNTTPTVSVNSASLCSGNTATLMASGASNYTWNTGAFTNSIEVTPTTSSVYTVTGYNGNCAAINTATVLVTPLPSVSIVSSGLFCNGQTITLTATGADSYTWSTNAITAVITVSTPGNYTTTGSTICGNATNTFNVIFTALPSVSLSASQYTICPNETTTLSANGTNGGNAYLWVDFPLNITNTQTVSTAGNFVVTYTNSCGTSTSNIVITQSTLTPSFAFTPSGGSAPVTITFNNTSSNNLTNNWTFGNGQSFSGISPGTIIYTTPGSYIIELAIQNSDGCTAVTSQILEILPGEFGPIPEAITPNGDGNNEGFKINGIEKYPSNELYIYNRWGNLVYSMKGYANNSAWEGKSNAEGKTGTNKLPPGTYFYLLILNDETRQTFRGFCELMY